MLVNSPSASYLTTQNLVKCFDEINVVDDVSLSINQGEIFALVGGSGCGKSTLLRLLAGFETPTSGSIYLGGDNLTNRHPYERPINMMFQSYALFPHLNVWDNLAFGLKREELSQDKIKARVESMLELVQLTSYAKRKPHQLSGGQQQRVALARSLAKRPSLLLLDEPLGALDKKLREHTQLELVNIIQKVGVTCVMVTHDQHEAMSMAHRIGVMSNGRILQTGSPEEIYDSPSNRFVADFIGNVNLLAGKVLDSIDLNNVLIETEIGNIVISNRKYFKPISEIFLAIRPEKVQLSKVIPLNQPNTFKGIVRNISFLGSYKIFKVLVNNFTIEINISTLHYLQDQIITGDSVYIWWANDSVLMLKD